MEIVSVIVVTAIKGLIIDLILSDYVCVRERVLRISSYELEENVLLCCMITLAK